MNYPHKILNNPKGLEKYFDGSRGFEKDEKDEEEEDNSPKDYEYQKQLLSTALINFESDYTRKYERRKINIPSIDYIRIDFLVTFDNNDDYKTKDNFIKKFGLRPIRYYNFNKSVLFEIVDAGKFETLRGYLIDYTESPASVSPMGQSYAIITIITGFKFLSREQILLTADLNSAINSVVLELTDREDIDSNQNRGLIFSAIVSFLQSAASVSNSIAYFRSEEYLTINGISTDTLVTLVDNFDLIASVQAIRVPRILFSNSVGKIRTYDFQIRPSAANLPIVTVIDNGVSRSGPLAGNVVPSLGYTFDSIYPAYSPIGWHGTAVAMIATVGEQFYSTASELEPACRIVSYRIFEDSEGQIDFLKLDGVVRDAYSKGSRIFNLSANTGFKLYNGDYSYFGYFLDKLSYELDILFVISAGNLNGDDLENIYNTVNDSVPYHGMLDYPRHFFYPEEISDEHMCDATNLKIPGDSLNNLTVGAIAENFDPTSSSDLTLDKTLPAYYTSKYNVSPFHKVNGTRLKSKHINYRLTKPDVVYPGGDYGIGSAAIQLVGTGVGSDLFKSECGTSFAAPFASNLAAQLCANYPTLNMQSIKALIINSASQTSDSDFLKKHLVDLKNSFSSSEFGKSFASLNKSERLKINKWFNDEDLLFKLTGHGLPNTKIALGSNRKSITVIIQDQIAIDTFKSVPINLPKYLNQFSKSTPIVEVYATLVFRFQPNFHEQMGYNPLHMSFNFIRTFGSPDNTAKIAAYRDGLKFYNELYKGLDEPKLKTARRNSELGIKSKVETWSDDFYPNGRQFSNSQKLKLQINVKDLAKTGNSISLIIRCTGKNTDDFNIRSYLAGNHPYSIVLTFSEKKNEELESYDFYDEFNQINQTLDLVAQGTLDADLDI